jgi:hypothetical protein
MPNFELVPATLPSKEVITLVRITEGEFEGVLIDIDEVKVTAEQHLAFTYNLYSYPDEKPDTARLDAAVEEIVYVILENIDQGEDGSEN